MPAPAVQTEVASDLHRLDKLWSHNGTTCARLGATRVSVTFWLEALQSDLQGIGIRDGKAQGRPGTPRRPRRGSTAAAAAALTEEDGSSMPPSSTEDEQADPVPQASASSAAVSPRAPRLLPVFHYTCDRERDTIKTERQRTAGLCLKWLSGGSIHCCPCSLHPSNPRDSSTLRCFPYSA